MVIHSNIVPEEQVRKVQRKTLKYISDALIKSFGPKGSSTAYVKNVDPNGVNITVEYTKDGHTIIKNILFTNPIERSVQDLLTDLTRRVVHEVGDGTTSAIILSKIIFDALCDNEDIKNMNPMDLINVFNDATKMICTEIDKLGEECTLDDIYNIALISTNNNEDIAATIKNIYEKFGMSVMIDVGISNEVENLVKEYDGMTLNTGFTDICFVNNKADNTAFIKNPKVYCFNDPIDTPEMLGFLDIILEKNILSAFRQGSVKEPVPTVIFAKQLSPDSSSYYETIVKLMNSYPGQVPLLMVTSIRQEYLYEDIAKMCGAPFIKKYINPEIQQLDIDKGLAPTPETIIDFCGGAELIEADQYKTKIIRPAKMFDEEGNYSTDYNMMVNYLETQVTKAIQEDAGIEEISRAKKRLNSFKGNMVDFLIGGVTLADKNNLKASVEDAVLNCRSAAANGVGFGANYMAYTVLYNNIKGNISRETSIILDIIGSAYKDLIWTLYKPIVGDKVDKEDFMHEMLRKGCPLNIRTGEYDRKVRSSIKSDVVILDTISKILTLMFTCNQYLTQTPMHNQYVDLQNEDE